MPESTSRDIQTQYDAIVIGGGVNGCGVARDLALRGVKVLLIEKGDFAMGTSWTSSGMIHGGARYLLSDIATTKKSCTDAGYIRCIAPHLIFRIPLMMPILKRDGLKGRINLEGADALFTVYDRYQPLKGGNPHIRLTPEEARRIEPMLAENLLGAVQTDEWGIDVPRLCVINILDAVEHGATAASWTAVTGFLREGRAVTGVAYEDRVTGRRGEARAGIVVNCAGPWATRVAEMAGARVELRPAKGIHLVLDRRISNIGVIAQAVDGRQVFVIPHENVSVIGTTDDDYFGDLDDIRILEDEIEYLLRAMETVLPRIREARIVKTIAGLRPTLFEQAKYEDDLTRDHRVFDHEREDGVPGLITLAGGKLAAYRIMAEDATDLACTKLGNRERCQTHLLPLPGGKGMPDIEGLAAKYRLDPYVVKRLAARQGSRTPAVLALIDENPAFANYVCTCEPVLEAELRYAIRREFVRHAVDLIGRCRLAEGPCQGYGCIVQAATIFGQERGLSPDDVADEALLIAQSKWRWRRDILAGPHLAQEELYRLVHLAVLDPLHVLKHRKEVF